MLTSHVVFNARRRPKTRTKPDCPVSFRLPRRYVDFRVVAAGWNAPQFSQGRCTVARRPESHLVQWPLRPDIAVSRSQCAEETYDTDTPGKGSTHRNSSPNCSSIRPLARGIVRGSLGTRRGLPEGGPCRCRSAP